MPRVIAVDNEVRVLKLAPFLFRLVLKTYRKSAYIRNPQLSQQRHQQTRVESALKQHPDRNIGYIIFTCTIILPISFFLLSFAARYTHASNVSLALLLETVLGPVWVWIGTPERPTPMMLFGGFIVILSLLTYLIVMRRQK